MKPFRNPRRLPTIDVGTGLLVAAIVMAFSLCGLFASRAGADQRHPFYNLIDTSSQRLALADKVALSKWGSKKPVEDLVRETIVIDRAVSRAAAYGLEESQVRQIMAGQIEANKLLQYKLLSNWRRDGTAPDESKLELESLRHELDRLETNLLVQLSSVQRASAQPNCVTQMAMAIEAYAVSNKIDVLHRVALERALGPACRSEQANTLAQGLSGRLSRAVFL